MFNQALLARQAWRLLTRPDSLCARLLKSKYYPNGKLEDMVFSGNASSTWTAISHGLDLLKKGLIWRVGNGRSIRIWRDAWIPRPFSYRPISAQGTCRYRFVSELLSGNGSISPRFFFIAHHRSVDLGNGNMVPVSEVSRGRMLVPKA